MKKTIAILAAALTAGAAFATTEPTPDFSTLPALSKERLSGSLTVGAATNYTGRGYVISHAVAQGDGMGFGAIKLNYDLGKKKDLWSIESTIAYKAPFSGHTLYGNAPVSDRIVAASYNMQNGTNLPPEAFKGHGKTIGAKNLENEFIVMTAAKYKRDKWNITFGHDFVRGGLLGAMAKHFHAQGASTVNEFFIAPEWTPYAWVAAGVKTSFSVQGVHGWWFEPYVTFKAPLIGTENGILSKAYEDLKLAAVVTFAMSATADYFDGRYNACDNGSQAFWIQVSTPWFVKDNFIITPSVSFNWLGEGGLKANQASHAKQYTENESMVPFRDFGVVGTLSATYTF